MYHFSQKGSAEFYTYSSAEKELRKIQFTVFCNKKKKGRLKLKIMLVKIHAICRSLTSLEIEWNIRYGVWKYWCSSLYLLQTERSSQVWNRVDSLCHSSCVILDIHDIPAAHDVYSITDVCMLKNKRNFSINSHCQTSLKRRKMVSNRYLLNRDGL